MICLSFLVPHDGGERVGFIITTILGIVFSMSMVSHSTPPIGDEPPPMILNFINYIYFLRMVISYYES